MQPQPPSSLGAQYFKQPSPQNLLNNNKFIIIKTTKLCQIKSRQLFKLVLQLVSPQLEIIPPQIHHHIANSNHLSNNNKLRQIMLWLRPCQPSPTLLTWFLDLITSQQRTIIVQISGLQHKILDYQLCPYLQPLYFLLG